MDRLAPPCGSLHRPVHPQFALSLSLSLRSAVLKASSGGLVGLWRQNGIRGLPWCVLSRPRVPELCLSSILRRRRGEIYQQIQLHAENSEVPAEKGGKPPPSHFPFTLPEAPGEYSPSCQCNVAHRGNHAASLASGCLLPAENATLALHHLTHGCCASLWEGFPHNMKPAPSCWGCTSAQPLPPLPPQVREYAPLLICELSPCGKRPQLDAAEPADTRRNIWIHDGRPLAERRGQSQALRWDRRPHTPGQSGPPLPPRQLASALPVSKQTRFRATIPKQLAADK